MILCERCHPEGWEPDADAVADAAWPEPGDPGYPGPVPVECEQCHEVIQDA